MGRWRANGERNIEPGGRQIVARGGATTRVGVDRAADEAPSRGTPGKTKMISEPRAWRVGGRKRCSTISRGLPATRSLRSGFRVYLTPNPAFGASRLALLACYALAGRCVAAPRWAMIMAPYGLRIPRTTCACMGSANFNLSRRKIFGTHVKKIAGVNLKT